MSLLSTNYYELSDMDDLQMNMILLNYLNLSQSGTYEYLFNTDYEITNIKPKIQIIKRSTPINKPTYLKSNNQSPKSTSHGGSNMPHKQPQTIKH